MSAPTEEEAIDTTRGRPIFILGCPRSGTTLLTLMLQSHPKIAMPPENRFVLHAYFDRARFGDLSRPEAREQLARMIVRSDNFDDLGLDREEIVRRVVDETRTVGSAVGLVLRAYADRFNKIRWGDKRPAYRHSVWAIRKMFPNAQFIHLVRDGRDCVASMERMPPWDERTSYRRIEAWMETVVRWQHVVETLPPDTRYELAYERLVHDPETELRGLCAFLGEQFSASMLSPERVAGQIVPERESWHANTRGKISAASVGGFQEKLTPETLSLCESVMGEWLERYGYPLTGAAPAPATELARFRKVYESKRRWVRQRNRQDRRLDYPFPVADMSISEYDLTREVGRLKARAASLSARVRAVESSRSWRWTAPLRR